MLTIKFENKSVDEAKIMTNYICRSLTGFKPFVDCEVLVPTPYEDKEGRWISEIVIGGDGENPFDAEFHVQPVYTETKNLEKHSGTFTWK